MKRHGKNERLGGTKELFSLVVKIGWGVRQAKFYHSNIDVFYSNTALSHHLIQSKETCTRGFFHKIILRRNQ